LMIMQARIGLSRQDIIDYVHGIVDIIIQISRNRDGQRLITNIYYRHG